MIETLNVYFSSPAYSFLLHENLRSPYGQDGFLIGEIDENRTTTITDNDQRQVNISKIVKINASIACPQAHYFYDPVGQVDAEKIKNFIGDFIPKIVGWYRYKPSSSFNFTFRDKIVHNQLSTFFQVPSELFTCCVLLSEDNDNASMHSYTQYFIRYHNHMYEQLPLKITNISEANNMYKRPERRSKTFQEIVGELNINYENTQGLTVVTKIHEALQEHTELTVEKLIQLEEKLFPLENEIKKLKEIVNSASCDIEDKLKDLNIMNIENSIEVTSLENSTVAFNESSPKKASRGRKKPVTEKSGKSNLRATRQSNLEEREIATRLRKRN